MVPGAGGLFPSNNKPSHTRVRDVFPFNISPLPSHSESVKHGGRAKAASVVCVATRLSPGRPWGEGFNLTRAQVIRLELPKGLELGPGKPGGRGLVGDDEASFSTSHPSLTVVPLGWRSGLVGPLDYRTSILFSSPVGSTSWVTATSTGALVGAAFINNQIVIVAKN